MEYTTGATKLSSLPEVLCIHVGRHPPPPPPPHVSNVLATQ